jgi:hypothetical protein
MMAQCFLWMGVCVVNKDVQQAVPVAQIDREAAAACARALGDGFTQHIVDGVEDETAIVQAFARHRLAALSRLTEPARKADRLGEGGGREAIARIIDPNGWDHADFRAARGFEPNDRLTRPSLITADRILAALPDPIHTREGEEAWMNNPLSLDAGLPDVAQARDAEGVAAFGAAMFQRIWDSFTDEGWEIEINDLVTVEAVKAGLVSVTPFDPEIHIDQSGAAEPGDDFYEVTPAGRAALNARGRA